MRFNQIFTAIIFATITTTANAASLPGTGDDADKTVIYRDTWGVPHVYAPTENAAMYAMGWAQAQDRPEEVLKNFARALGESAKFEGPGAFMADLRTHMWRHYEISRDNVEKVNPVVRGHVQAFVNGINDFYKAHPEDVPEWWGNREVDEYMSMAFGRLFLYNWSIDDAYSDLERAGIDPGFDKTERASNQFAVSKQRSANGAPILYIDPHLSWFGPSRFWEFRVHAGEYHGSGFNLAGTPYIGLGHNADLAWAMTTGGPDTADVYELALDPNDPMKYKYDDTWKTITKREVTLEAKGGEKKTFPIFDSHYGPIIAMRGGKAYAAKVSYADCVQGNESWYALNFGKDYKAVIAAAETQMIFPQNIMAADTAGNIYYQRTGRVPKRTQGLDWSKPVDGALSANEWQGLEPVEAHVQILNPECGYMQNCNIPPDAMMPHSPLTPDKFSPELFSDLSHGPRGGWSNQRGARAIEVLAADDSVTIDEAKHYALELHPYGAERWVKALLDADAAHGDNYKDNDNYQAGMRDIIKWDQTLSADSRGALKYFYWRKQLLSNHGEDTMKEAGDAIDQIMAPARGEKPTQPELDSEQQEAALNAFDMAMSAIVADFGKLDVTYGDKFRVGRDDKSWPSSGGGDRNLGMVTLRNTNYSSEKEDKTRWGTSGQTSTQIVVMTKPVQSWTQPPLGQSDRPDSPHYRDQAEKVFGKVTLKPTWWQPKDLAKNIESREVLTSAP